MRKEYGNKRDRNSDCVADIGLPRLAQSWLCYFAAAPVPRQAIASISTRISGVTRLRTSTSVEQGKSPLKNSWRAPNFGILFDLNDAENWGRRTIFLTATIKSTLTRSLPLVVMVSVLFFIKLLHKSRTSNLFYETQVPVICFGELPGIGLVQSD